MSMIIIKADGVRIKPLDITDIAEHYSCDEFYGADDDGRREMIVDVIRRYRRPDHAFTLEWSYEDLSGTIILRDIDDVNRQIEEGIALLGYAPDERVGTEAVWSSDRGTKWSTGKLGLAFYDKNGKASIYAKNLPEDPAVRKAALECLGF